MSRAEHKAVVKAAKKGAPLDLQTARLALHWAWAVIGPPEERRKYPWLQAILDGNRRSLFTDIYDGRPAWDEFTYVRKDARRVEAACLAYLESVGADAGTAA